MRSGVKVLLEDGAITIVYVLAFTFIITMVFWIATRIFFSQV